MAKRATRTTPRPPTPTTLCNEVHALADGALRAMHALETTNVPTGEEREALERAMQELIGRVKAVVGMASTAGGFTAGQREAVCHMVNLLAHYERTSASAVETFGASAERLTELRAILLKICCRLAPRA